MIKKEKLYGNKHFENENTELMLKMLYQIDDFSGEEMMYRLFDNYEPNSDFTLIRKFLPIIVSTIHEKHIKRNLDLINSLGWYQQIINELFDNNCFNDEYLFGIFELSSSHIINFLFTKNIKKYI